MNTCLCIWVRWKHFIFVIQGRHLSTASLLRRRVWTSLIPVFPIPAHQKATGMTLTWKHYLLLTIYILFTAVTNCRFPIYSCNVLWCNTDIHSFHRGFFACKGSSSTHIWFKSLVMEELSKIVSKAPISHWPVCKNATLPPLLFCPEFPADFVLGRSKVKTTKTLCETHGSLAAANQLFLWFFKIHCPNLS